MTNCEQLAGELKVLEELLRQTSTEHKRQEIIDRIDQIKAEQQKHGCLEAAKSRTTMKYQGCLFPPLAVRRPASTICRTIGSGRGYSIGWKNATGGLTLLAGSVNYPGMGGWP